MKHETERDLHSRHGLVDGLHTETHGELIHDLLWHVIEVNLPGVVAFDLRDLHDSVVLDLRQVVEEILHRNQQKLFSGQEACRAF